MRGDVLGVVLAGGGSRRMGRDKALLAVEGTPLVVRAAELMASVCSEAVVAVAPGRHYADLPLPTVEDRRAGGGPLAGMEAAAVKASGRPILVLACDLPRVDRAVLERLASYGDLAAAASRPSAWVARRDGRLQPLCGLYSAACGPVFVHNLDRGRRAVLAAVTELEVEAVTFDDLSPDPFLNVNTPADYERAGGRAASC